MARHSEALGQHTYYIQWMNIAEILYGPTIFIIKMSILVQYLRMLAPSRTVNPEMFWGSWVVILVSFMFYTIDTFITILACNPRPKIWNKLIPGGTCMNYDAVIAATGFFNIFSDVAILVLPIRTVWQLRIPRQKKIALSMLFATGTAYVSLLLCFYEWLKYLTSSRACVASAVRIMYTFQIIRQGNEADVSFNVAWMGIWSLVEEFIGISVACLLSLPKLLRARSCTLHSTVSSIGKRFPSIKTPSFATRHTPSEATEPEVLLERTKDVAPRLDVSEADLAFETGSYHLYPLPSQSSSI
jgi:hypothetical protein